MFFFLFVLLFISLEINFVINLWCKCHPFFILDFPQEVCDGPAAVNSFLHMTVLLFFDFGKEHFISVTLGESNYIKSPVFYDAWRL